MHFWTKWLVIMSWDWQIRPETKWFEWNLKEIWTYRHLLQRLIRRDFLTMYQQTLLGPVWIIVQPLITVFMYVLIFDRVVGISTNNLPPFLFYMSGIVVWNLFAETFLGTVFTFNQNATLFTKVYFPRLIIPLSVSASQALRFMVQFMLFLCFYCYYLFTGIIPFQPLLCLIALAFVILIAGGLGLGLGLSFSILLVKYRDLSNLVQLGIRLLLFATPVIYPFSIVPAKYKWLLSINPLVPVIEFYRYAYLGVGSFAWPNLLYAFACMVILFLLGALLFNKVGGKLIDVV